MFVLFRALVWSSLFIGVVLLYVPSRLVSVIGLDRTLSTPLLIIGVIMGLLGAFVAAWSIGSFVKLGSGTPAPFDPPVQLVTRGPYRFARNPMYVGAGLALLGAALVYQSWIIAGYVGFLFVITHSFVLFYEEPTLRRLFGVDYLDYCARVRR
jgi:protein-S-isoprenylcysteine O-methyltransferase Ste14